MRSISCTNTQREHGVGSDDAAQRSTQNQNKRVAALLFVTLKHRAMPACLPTHTASVWEASDGQVEIGTHTHTHTLNSVV